MRRVVCRIYVGPLAPVSVNAVVSTGAHVPILELNPASNSIWCRFIKVCDFGFAKKVFVDRTYTRCGTPDYTSPEMLRGEGVNQAIQEKLLHAHMLIQAEAGCAYLTCGLGWDRGPDLQNAMEAEYRLIGG